LMGVQPSIRTCSRRSEGCEFGQLGWYFGHIPGEIKKRPGLGEVRRRLNEWLLCDGPGCPEESIPLSEDAGIRDLVCGLLVLDQAFLEVEVHFKWREVHVGFSLGVSRRRQDYPI
jgi:hypothetical protein